MSIYMRSIQDGITLIRTKEDYFIKLLNQCKFAKHEKTTRMGATFILNKDLSLLPNNIFKLADYLRRIKEEN